MELDDFVSCCNTMDIDSDSSGVQQEQGEFGHDLAIEKLCKNQDDEGEFIPITVGKFYSLSPCSTDSQEYEFDSLLEETTKKDVDQVYIY